jgi:hypothetical protein
LRGLRRKLRDARMRTRIESAGELDRESIKVLLKP